MKISLGRQLRSWRPRQAGFAGATDTFNRADAGSLGTTSDGLYTWTDPNSSFEILSNRAAYKSGSSTEIAYIDVGESDVIYTVSIITGSSAGGDYGAVFRLVDVNNYWWCGYNKTDENWELIEFTSGSGTLRDNTTVTGLSLSTPYPIVITLSGTSISATLNGTGALSYSSSTHQAGTGYGIRARSAYKQFDTLSIVGN